jgi:hypothetical protein
VKNPTLGTLFALDAKIVEIARIPQRVEVALNACRIINVAGTGKHAGSDGFGGDSAIAVNPYVFNDSLLRERHTGKQHDNQAKAKQTEQPAC